MKSSGFNVVPRGHWLSRAIALALITAPMLIINSAEAQTAQFIVNSPPELAGSYAAVTYDSPPSNVTSTTPIAEGNILIYDGVNCSTHTLTKPVAGSGAGKVALLTGPYPTTCTYYDDMVRELQADGVVAVVLGFSRADWRQVLFHVRPAGLTVPVLYMEVDEVSQAIRSAVVSGTTVAVSFVAVPGMVMHAAATSVLAGGSAAFPMPAFATPSTGATFDFSSVDLDRTVAGLQQSFVTLADSNCGAGISFSYDQSTRLVTATVPVGDTLTGLCTKTFLIRDTAGFQGIGLLDLYVGVPIALDDQAQVASGGTVSIDVLANDIGDPSIKVGANIDLNPPTTAIDQSVAVPEGLWRVVGDNVEFASAAGFVGVVSIGYVVRGANGGSSNQATITVNVGAPQIAPIPGVWWNKAEPGSGFGLDYENGTLIVQAYSYLAGGASQWYLAAGPVVNNVFTATLDKYMGGQCISCAYMAPELSGNDGTITITFTSSTTATVDLPGGRHIQIQRYFQSAPIAGAFVPVPGVWWNKDESGSGLGLDYENGTLIAEVYSYVPGGASQWYLAAGPVINGVFTATLDKYTGGQCISCAYKAPVLSGNDGPITITFSSPTTATVDLPAGRHIQIERYFQSSHVSTQ